ncbi:SAM-dependent methyltransferase [Pseudonocardia acaciae]|uniref:SAM-dependent methyltransferase n=1 Tax=Pseudonocardia acaciae TaxID=551276 RepID=UPI000685AF0E|nr:SAM-dependent methyltransferase [Pseudonocardia acaciae]
MSALVGGGAQVLGAQPKVQFDVPHSARIWNYWMGGKDNYPVDRLAGDAVAAVYPRMGLLAKQSRQFLIRVVRFLAGEAGVDQFLDIGAGLPIMQNTHEVAHEIAPRARVVYVDNDPLVLTHARALLTHTTPEGATAHIGADCRDPDVVLAGARGVLDLDRPVAVMLMGVLGYVSDTDQVREIVARTMDAVPSGSYLALWDCVSTSKAMRAVEAAYARTGAMPYTVRDVDLLAGCFDGLDVVDPGFVSISQWRPEAGQVGGAIAVDGYGAVARKP